MSQDNKPPIPPKAPIPRDWRELAERASKEPDPEKLTQLIEELCDSIDRLRAERRNRMSPPPKADRGPDGAPPAT